MVSNIDIDPVQAAVTAANTIIDQPQQHHHHHHRQLIDIFIFIISVWMSFYGKI